jgi:GrpB-like predicted nucleotidyltransferase (UPF0157 family)
VADLRLAAYDAEWPRRYADEAPRVAAAIGDVIDIAHVGSTSVPGLAAKPTIDIAVGIASLQLDPQAHERMAGLGYAYGGDHGLPQHIFRKGAAVPWAFLVHVVEHEGWMWRDFLRFREHLRTHPADARRYAELKGALLRGSEGWYSGADKAEFIHPIIGR